MIKILTAKWENGANGQNVTNLVALDYKSDLEMCWYNQVEMEHNVN